MIRASARAVAAALRRWAPAGALSLAAHGALAAGLFGLAGLARPPAPDVLVPVELVVEIAPGETAPAAPSGEALSATVPESGQSADAAPEASAARPGSPPAPRPPPPPRAKPAPVPQPLPDPVARPVREPPPPRETARAAAPADASASLSSARPSAPPPTGDAAEGAPRPSSGTGVPSPSAAPGNAPPRYPDRARRDGLEGSVLLRVEVAASGRADRVTVVESSGHRLLDRAARRAVERWRFVPARHDGAAVTGTVDVPVTFRLEE